MNIIYTGEKIPDKISKSLFLAGPSLRPDQEGKLQSWRKEALQILEDLEFDGTVFCPENRGFSFKKDFNYDDQIEWEQECLNIADLIVFWVPRDLKALPAFTTNIEWGRWEGSGKIVLGFPKDADKMDYIKLYADKLNIPNFNSLDHTLEAAINKIGQGVERSGGERYVPLYIWNTPAFQSWYQSQRKAGNRLDHAEVLYVFRPSNKNFVFLWILKVDIYISAENRHKTNEFVLARPDISTICMFKPNDNILETEIVLIKEFRSPAATEDGFIRELVSGSSPKPASINETIFEEVLEETGLQLDTDRLKSLGGRQLCGTLSSHKSHLFSYQLNEEELNWLKSQVDIAHGKIEDSERTYVEIHTLNDLLNGENVDWSTLGQIALSLQNEIIVKY